MTSIIGQSLGRYHIIEQLGEGGMATVYKAYDTRLENEVAVKVIRTERFTPEILARALKRFEREAKALARLTHPNIVKVTDYGEYEGQPYLVMPFLAGGNLKQYLRERGPLPWQEAVRFILPILGALDYAHSQNVIHRDVKPANILLTESGQPMLTDFGVAKIIEEEATVELTGTGMAVGTPEYMAPEQTGKQIDQRVDVYALGVVFYEMLTGRRPYEADTPLAVLVKQMAEPLPPPRQYAPNLPEKVEQILYKALAKDPANRYQSMAEFASALERLLSLPAAKETRKVKREQPAPTPNIQKVSAAAKNTFALLPTIPTPPAERQRSKKSLIIRWLLILGATGLVFLMVILVAGFIIAKNNPTLSPWLSFTPTEITINKASQYPVGQPIIVSGLLHAPAHRVCTEKECALVLTDTYDLAISITIYVTVDQQGELDKNRMSPLPASFTNTDVMLKTNTGEIISPVTPITITGRICGTVDGEACIDHITKISTP